MINNKPLCKEVHCILPLMKAQNLRKVVSDVSTEFDNNGKDLEALTRIDEVVQEECTCCGLKEDCTQGYIAKVKNSHAGKWVCGLCSEAVKERLLRSPRKAMEEAVNTQREFCQNFKTTRLNPKLSLTWAMKNIAKRSLENRNLRNSSKPNICRSSSCIPRINLNIK